MKIIDYNKWKRILSSYWNQNLDYDDYDYEKYYNDDPKEATRQLLRILNGSAGHFPDGGKSGMYKTINHPTYPDLGEDSWSNEDKVFHISDRQLANTDRILSYLGNDLKFNNGGTKVVYGGAYMLPSVVVTPKGGYTPLVPNANHTGFVYRNNPRRATKYLDGGDIKYTIKPGESLSVIANKNGYSTKDLMKANGIVDADRIQAGQTILLPTKTSAATIFNYMLDILQPTKQEPTSIQKIFLPIKQLALKEQKKRQEYVYDKLKETLPGLENSQKEGLTAKGWVPHNSPEGGAKTIYYGLKLEPNAYPEIQRLLRTRGYITEEEARKAFEKAIRDHYSYTKDWYNKYFNDSGAFNKLDVDTQALLADYVYNMGPEKFFSGFPKFLKAIHNKDYDTAIEEYHSNAGENRNNYRLNYLNTIKKKYNKNGNLHSKKRRHLNKNRK